MQVRWDELTVCDQAAVQLERLWGVLASLPTVPKEFCMAAYASDEALTRATGTTEKAAKHRDVLELVAMSMRSYGLTIHIVSLEPDAYFAWLGNRENTSDARSLFVTLAWSNGQGN